ncbi:MAG: apolipoprotein N-acyltransferase [Hormoscilla sp. GUM202]|nr:apolipoprotein N-acyltransferase [Hormoscilla sp. GUM202]
MRGLDGKFGLGSLKYSLPDPHPQGWGYKNEARLRGLLDNIGLGSLKYSLLFGLAWGIGYHGIALFWITGIHPMTWLGVPWLASLAIALFCWIFITLWGASLVVAWSAGMKMAISSGGMSQGTFQIALLRVLMGVAFWCVLEGLWSTGSLWWTSLSFTQSPDNLAILQLGKISGHNTITAAIVAVNGLIAETFAPTLKGGATGTKCSPLRTRFSARASGCAACAGFNASSYWKYLSLAAGLLLTLHMAGFFMYSRPLHDRPADALKVGIVQGNIPNEIKLYTAGGRRALSGYTRGYKILAAQGVDAVLIPETALPFVWTAQNNSSFNQAIRDSGAIAWVGAFGQQGNSLTNSLFTVTGTGDIFSRYDKIKLVPLGEFIPFEQFLGKLIDRLSPLDAHLVAGKAEQLFDTPFGRAIAAICYDSAFAEVFRLQAAAGGQFILTAANNAHYSATMPAQHHAQDVMRAIETDRWAVRATNTGYSAIVDPHGRTVWISGINTYEIHAATIYPRQTQTLYVHWGDWLTPVLVGLAALGFLAWQRSQQLDS